MKYAMHNPIAYLNVELAGEVLALRHTKEAELLPAPAVIGEAVILADQLPAAAIRPCTFRCTLLGFDIVGKRVSKEINQCQSRCKSCWA